GDERARSAPRRRPTRAALERGAQRALRRGPPWPGWNARGAGDAGGPGAFAGRGARRVRRAAAGRARPARATRRLAAGHARPALLAAVPVLTEARMGHEGDHEHADHPGHFQERDVPRRRDFRSRAFTVGVGGPVGSGKTGPGITQSDLLVINKTDLAPHVGADLGVMDRDARRMRGDGPTVFAQVTKGTGVDAIASHVVQAWRRATKA